MVAGVVASNNGLVEECVNYAPITGSADTISGVVAYMNAGKLVDCKNFGIVTGKGWNTSGITSGTTANCTEIIGCVNYAKIVGAKGVSGVIGDGRVAMVDGCINYGVLSATSEYNGGVIRVLKADATISNCYNFGSLNSPLNYAGGIIGRVEGTTFNFVNCHNYGVITANKNQAVGILGRPKCTTINMENCSNHGELKSTNSGALIGWQEKGNLIAVNCSNYVSITNGSSVFVANVNTGYKVTLTNCNDYSAD